MQSRLIIGVILVWIPVLELVIARLLWTDVIGQVPVHWAIDGEADGFSSSAEVFLFSLFPSAVCAIIASAAGLSLQEGGSRQAIGLGFGTLALLGGAVGQQWSVSQLTAAAAQDGGTSSIGTPFLLYVCSVALALLTYGVLVFPRPRWPRVRARESEK